MSEQKDFLSRKTHTPEEILRYTVSQFNQLENQADEAIIRTDLATRRQKLIERARLIADLPDKIRATFEKGKDFPNGELETLESFAELARERLHLAQQANEKSKAGGDFALSTLLIEKGKVKGEPNLLEELVNRLYPPNDRK